MTTTNTTDFGRYSSNYPQPSQKDLAIGQETGHGSSILPVPQEFFRLAQQFEIPTTSKSKRRQGSNHQQKR